VRFQRMQADTEVYYVCADDTHWHADHAARRPGSITPGATDRPRVRRAYRDIRRLHVAFRQLLHDDSPENRAFCEDIYTHLKAKDLIARRSDRAVLRPGQADVPAGPLYQGRVPELPLQGPVRRFLPKVLRQKPTPRPISSTLIPSCREQAAAQGVRHHFFKLSDERWREFLRRVHADQRMPPARSGKQDERVDWVSPAIASWQTGTFPATPPTSASDPRHQQPEVFLCLAGCAGGLLRQFRQLRLPNRKRRARPLTRTPSCARAAIPRWSNFHRQGHSVFPALFWPAMAESRLPRATKVFAHGFSKRWTDEDVQVPGQLHHGGELPSSRG